MNKYIFGILLLLILIGSGVLLVHAQEGECPAGTAWDGIKCAPIKDKGGNNNCPAGFRFDPGENGCVEIFAATWTSTPSPTATNTPTITPTSTLTPTNTPTKTPTPTKTLTPTPTRSLEELRTAMRSVKEDTHRYWTTDPLYIYSIKDESSRQELENRIIALYGSSTCAEDDYQCRQLACELECNPVDRDVCVLNMKAYTVCGRQPGIAEELTIALSPHCQAEFRRQANIRKCDNIGGPKPRAQCRNFKGLTNIVAYTATAFISGMLLLGGATHFLMRRRKKK